MSAVIGGNALGPAQPSRPDASSPLGPCDGWADAATNEALSQAQAGVAEAFGDLVRAHQGRVYSLALRMLGVREDAEELAQDVFLLLHRSLHDIVSTLHLRFWLRRTVCHRAIDRLRRRPKVALVPLEAAAELAVEASSADPLRDRLLRMRVTQLAPAARAVVLLRYQEDLDPSQISRVLGVPLNTVKSHLKRSLALLRRTIEPAGDTGRRRVT